MMGDVKVCRMCLRMDVQMYDISASPWSPYFENIIANYPMVPLPECACYECCYIAKKSHIFRNRCIKGQATLFQIYQTNGKLTRQEIENIDREFLNLSNLTLQKDSELNTIHINYVGKTKIKSESVKLDDDLDNSDLDDIDNTKDDQTFEIPIEVPLATENIKQEEYDFSPDISSDDDEPLSIHKSIKEKKAKKVVKKEAKVDSEKRKRGRPRKNKPETGTVKPKPSNAQTMDTELEEYVDIIKLTLEEQIQEVLDRRTSSNYLNSHFKCELCFKGFIDTNAWNHHLTKHDPKTGDIVCPVCKIRFSTKRAYQKHATNHEKKFVCKSCSYVSKHPTQAKQHQRWHKGFTYKCQYCDEVSTKWTSFLSHVRIKHPSSFICGVCGYSFVSKIGLAMHKSMMHKDVVEKKEETELEAEEKPGPYCSECDVQFMSVEAYKRHMVNSVKHMQLKDFGNGCRACGESFKDAEELRLHQRSAHAKRRPKNYGKKPSNMSWPAQCEHCQEEIPNAREYWTHFRRAHPDKTYPSQKNYICDICGKGFRSNAFLVYHKRTHSEERAYKCNQCPKAFFNRTNLQMHEKTHSDHRPYPCSVCFKAFKCKGALDRHFRSHTGVKPYECEVCGKAFNQSNSRKLHVMTVHLKQPAPYVSRVRLERRRLAHQALAPH